MLVYIKRTSCSLQTYSLITYIFSRLIEAFFTVQGAVKCLRIQQISRSQCEGWVKGELTSNTTNL